MKKNHPKSTEYNEQKQKSKDQLIQRLYEVEKQSKSPKDTIIEMLYEEDNEKLEKLMKKLGIWPCSIDYQFIEDLLQQPEIAFEIFVYMILISNGYFCPLSPITTTNLITALHCGLLQNYFCCVTPENYHIYFEIGLEKEPIIQKNEFGGFQTIHKIHFIALRFDRKIENVLRRLFNYHTLQKINFYRQNFDQLSFDSTTSIQKKQKYFCLEKPLFSWNVVEQWGECQFNIGQKDQQCVRWIPTEIQTKKQNEKYLKQYYYDSNLNQWVKNEDIVFLQKYNQNRDQSKQNKHILQQYADFESAALIIDIMQQLPDFKISITQQERSVIASKQNSLIIGRSGTGKTTCTVLRLFAIQILFKIRQKLYNQENEKLLYNNQDIKNKIGLHCIFTTQNQLLIKEIRNYYRKLLKHIQDSIKRNQQKYQNQKQNVPLSMDQSFASQSMQICDEINESSISMILQEESFMSVDYDNNNKEEMEDDDELEDVDKLNSLEQLSDDKFPAFLSLKKLILLIDSSLNKPFFQQTRFFGKRLEKAGWNNGQIIKIPQKHKIDQCINFNGRNDDAKQGFPFLSQEENQKKVVETKLLLQIQEEQKQQSNIQVTEVDFEYFIKRFWPTIKKQNQKQGCDERSFPTLIWTQIYSYIKGSQFSYSYPMKYLPKAIYTQLNPSNLSSDMINLIYDYFLEYEKWKLSCGIFDLMDLVNYIICELDKGDFKTVPIHYLFVDEIQDFPHAVITLFTRLIEQGYYFCGDTAQNIVKGVGFRFQDFKKMFKHIDNPLLAEFEQFQLTINFRSHNNILQLANCIVNLIEFFFPKAIDRLNKEISDLNGPIPIIIQSNKIEDLFTCLTSNVNHNKKQGLVPIEFGCNQVVLVKDSEARDKIPSALQHALTLTIYESKGLEFEDVILFNFFTDNTILQSQWELLNHLFIEEVEIDRDQYNNKLTRHEQQYINKEDIQENNASFSTQNEKGNVIIKKLRLNPSIKSVDLNNYNELCNELKYLYVAATRAKNKLIIFDEQPEKRCKIQELWQSLSLIQIFDASSLQHTYHMNSSISQNTKEEWYQTGMKMFANKYYDQAMKCFEMAGNQQLCLKSSAYAFALKAEKLLIQTQNLAELNQDTHIPFSLRRQNKEQFEKLKQAMLENYIKASEKFLQCNMKKNAAACFFSGQQFQQSLIYYLEAKCWEEAAEVALKLQNYHIAGILWLKSYKIEQSIEAFNQFKNNLITLHLLYKFKYQFGDHLKDLWLILLPKVFQECWIKYYELQDVDRHKYSGKEIDFSILKKHTDFKTDFKNELLVIQTSVQNLSSKVKMYETLFNYIHNFLDEILMILSIVYINYPLSVQKGSMLQRFNELDQNQMELIQNVLEYFQVEDLQLFMLETKKSNNWDNYFISRLYDISPLYQPQFSLNYQFSNYEKVNTTDLDKIQNSLKISLKESENILSRFTFSTENKFLMSYSFCQLGLYEIAIQQYQKQITLLKSTQGISVKVYMQNFRNLLLLFQQYEQLLSIYKNDRTIKNYEYIQAMLGFYYSQNWDHDKLKQLIDDEYAPLIQQLKEKEKEEIEKQEKEKQKKEKQEKEAKEKEKQKQKQEKEKQKQEKEKEKQEKEKEKQEKEKEAKEKEKEEKEKEEKEAKEKEKDENYCGYLTQLFSDSKSQVKKTIIFSFLRQLFSDSKCQVEKTIIQSFLIQQISDSKCQDEKTIIQSFLTQLFSKSNCQIEKTIILSFVAHQNENIMPFLFELNYQDFQYFLIELQKVLDLFKYNRYIDVQNETLNSICAIYQLSIATSEDFQFLGQSYIIVHKSSLIFRSLVNNYKQQQFQAFSFDFKGELFLFSSELVINTIQKIYKDFLKTYVLKYCMQNTAIYKNVPFLIQIYSFCAIKMMDEEDNIDDQYLKKTLANQSLLNCLEYQLSDQMFNIWYQIPEFKKDLNRRTFEDLTYKSFAKVLTDKTKEELHIHLLTGINAQNIAFCYDISLQFIENLIQDRKNVESQNKIKNYQIAYQHPFLTQKQLLSYKNYINYLLGSRISMSMENIAQYIEYHISIYPLSFSGQIYRDLTFCTLTYIICKRSHYKFSKKMAQLENEALENEALENEAQDQWIQEQQILDEIGKLRSFKLKQSQKMNLILPKKSITFLQTLKNQQVQIDEEFDDSSVQKFSKFLIELFKTKTKEELPLFLLAAIIINVDTINVEIQMALENELNKQISDKRRDMIEDILSLAKQDFEKRHNLVLEAIKEEQSNFAFFAEQQISYSNISMETFKNKCEDVLKYQLKQKQINEEIDKHFKQQKKKKFKSLYIGMRFSTYQPLLKDKMNFSDHVLKLGCTQIYDKFNNIRSKLINIFYTQQLQKPSNFISIMKELNRLVQLEAKLDEEQISLQNKYPNKQNRQKEDEEKLKIQQKEDQKKLRKKFEDQLYNLDQKIETWIKQNIKLQNRFLNIENYFNKNVKQKSFTM